MARQRIAHGATIDTMTVDEMRALRQEEDARTRGTRVRAAATVALDATGAGQDEVYTVPVGWEFEARRVSLELSSASDPLTGNVALNVAGKSVRYLRSGAPIAWANPQSPAGVASIPGSETWGDEQGPYLRNGEVFEVKAAGLTAGAQLDVTVEGILYRRDSGHPPAAPQAGRARR